MKLFAVMTEKKGVAVSPQHPQLPSLSSPLLKRLLVKLKKKKILTLEFLSEEDGINQEWETSFLCFVNNDFKPTERTTPLKMMRGF